MVFTPLKNNSVRIEGMCEYSLSNLDIRSGNYKNKLTSLSDFHIQNLIEISNSSNIASGLITTYIRLRYPDFRRNIGVSLNPKLFPVLPDGVEIPSDSSVEKYHVPITTLTFRNFLDAFMDDASAMKNIQ